MTRRSVRVMTLRDGRKLGWREFGDPSGAPCIYVTGITASGAAGRLYDVAASQAGVRWISVDKPGYGRSDFHPGRRLPDWPDDMAQLAGRLGLDRFAVAGESGGGPHALAVASYLADRVAVAIVIGGMGPWHEGRMRRGMKPEHYDVYDAARRFPRRLRQKLLALAHTLDDPARRKQWLRAVVAAAPEADRALFRAFPQVLRIAIKAYREALRPGPAGAIQELRMFTQPWGFSLRSIRVPVYLWHGVDDVNVPITVARDMAARIPHCSAHFIENTGHALYWRIEEIVGAVHHR
jgi:pimeloyl-ACP methyl ester carboxylesterase